MAVGLRKTVEKNHGWKSYIIYGVHKLKSMKLWVRGVLFLFLVNYWYQVAHVIIHNSY